jgi:UDP-N-acetylmuramoyl-L-alanyl-D-glutamate--2,6-diaminopimelate ligase
VIVPRPEGPQLASLRLADLLASLPDASVPAGSGAAIIGGISADSRQITPGTLFVAYRGTGNDGHRFIGEAVRRGAAAVVGEEEPRELPVPYIRVTDGRAALSWLWSAWYGHPSREMRLIGITGTDGKTTTANLVHGILRAAGSRVGLISTVNAVIGDETIDTGLHTTTPDAPDVQRYLAQMLAAGADTAILEATSHGLAQGRVAACAFDVAVITNITHEHLDFHGTFDAYRAAKALLFRSLANAPSKAGVRKAAILNRDDPSYGFLSRLSKVRIVSYGLASTSAAAELLPDLSLSASGLVHGPDGVGFDITFGCAQDRRPPAGFHVASPLLGRMNAQNVLAATATAIALDVPPAAIQAGLSAVRQVPGRLEKVERGQPFVALVDFAHTPNALAQVLETARDLAAPGGRVLVVFGCAGLRDRQKRVLMGEVSARLADFTVITAEDPRTESLDLIMAETAAACRAAGRPEGTGYICEPDRQRAIQRGVEAATPGDVLLICGKGHEESMCFGDVEFPWQDRQALAWALNRHLGRGDTAPPFILPTWRPD